MGPTCDARLDVMVKGVIAQNTFERVVVGQRKWARSNQRHFTSQNIQDLGQLVDTCRSQQPSNGCHSRIITGRLYNGWSILLDRHSSKFEYDKSLAVESLSALPRNYRSRTIELDCDGGKNHER